MRQARSGHEMFEICGLGTMMRRDGETGGESESESYE